MSIQNTRAQEDEEPRQENEEEEGVEGGIRQEERVAAFTRVEELESHGINKSDVTKLKEGGYHTIEAVAHATTRKLCEVKGLSEAKVTKLKSTIKARQLVPTGFCSATSKLIAAQDIVMISTGSAALDLALGGGIETGSITELFGTTDRLSRFTHSIRKHFVHYMRLSRCYGCCCQLTPTRTHV
jgi:DNA repair protein RAD51